MSGSATESWATAILPLKRYADFRGRSSRTELVGFYAVTMLANVAVVVVDPWAHAEATRWLRFGLAVVLLCPIAALMVRRLHDVGFSGWWLVPMLPIAAKALWELFQRIRDPYWMQPDLPIAVALAGFAYLLAIIVLLMWNDQEGANRFGPNPRERIAGEMR